jgi:hypothetical protein
MDWMLGSVRAHCWAAKRIARGGYSIATYAIRIRAGIQFLCWAATRVVMIAAMSDSS